MDLGVINPDEIAQINIIFPTTKQQFNSLNSSIGESNCPFYNYIF